MELPEKQTKELQQGNLRGMAGYQVQDDTTQTISWQFQGKLSNHVVEGRIIDDPCNNTYFNTMSPEVKAAIPQEVRQNLNPSPADNLVVAIFYGGNTPSIAVSCNPDAGPRVFEICQTSVNKNFSVKVNEVKQGLTEVNTEPQKNVLYMVIDPARLGLTRSKMEKALTEKQADQRKLLTPNEITTTLMNCAADHFSQEAERRETLKAVKQNAIISTPNLSNEDKKFISELTYETVFTPGQNTNIDSVILSNNMPKIIQGIRETTKTTAALSVAMKERKLSDIPHDISIAITPPCQEKDPPKLVAIAQSSNAVQLENIQSSILTKTNSQMESHMQKTLGAAQTSTSTTSTTRPSGAF